MKTHPIFTFVITLCLIAGCGVVYAATWPFGLVPQTLLGQNPDPAAARSAESELRRARSSLSQASSLSARLVETISLFDRNVRAEGRYLQSSNRRIRLELKLKLGQTSGSLLEVCDGEILWSKQDVGPDTTITRRNVNQILDAARQSGAVPENMLIADLGLGGLPALLASIERSFDFTGLKSDRLRDRPVVILQGQWKPPVVATLNPGGDPNQLPPYIPDLIRIYLDEETGFPLRIMYLKKIPDRDTLRSLLTLDFLDPQVGQELPSQEFVFVPPSQPQPIELTHQYLQQLRPANAGPSPAAPPGGPAAAAPPASAPPGALPAGGS